MHCISMGLVSETNLSNEKAKISIRTNFTFQYIKG